MNTMNIQTHPKTEVKTLFPVFLAVRVSGLPVRGFGLAIFGETMGDFGGLPKLSFNKVVT